MLEFVPGGRLEGYRIRPRVRAAPGPLEGAATAACAGCVSWSRHDRQHPLSNGRPTMVRFGMAGGQAGARASTGWCGPMAASSRWTILARRRCSRGCVRDPHPGRRRLRPRRCPEGASDERAVTGFRPFGANSINASTHQRIVGSGAGPGPGYASGMRARLRAFRQRGHQPIDRLSHPADRADGRRAAPGPHAAISYGALH
ncbi:hypothetical protein ACU4GD_08930 [Cupriavidus basilensis]